MQRRLGAILAVAFVASGSALSPVAAGAAPPPASHTVTLPGSFRDMVVDPATGRVFIAATDVVAIYDEEGTLLSTVPNQTSASGLAIDGGSVYVALAGSATINRIATSTLTVTGSWAIGRPLTGAIAVSGGMVWFVSPAPEENGAVGSLDPSNGQVTHDVITEFQPTLPVEAFAVLRAAPTRPGELYVGDRFLARWNIAVTPPVRTAFTTQGVSDNLRDFRVSPDGQLITTAHGASYTFEEIDADTLELTGLRYQGPTGGNAIAYSADGRVHAGGGDTTYWEAYVHAAGTATAALRVELGFAPADRGLGLNTDGSVLYAAGGTRLRIERLGDPHLDPTWSGDGIAGLTGNQYRVAMAPLDSGRLFVASYQRGDDGAMRLTRYEPNGTRGSFPTFDGVLRRRFAPSTTAISFPTHVVRTGDKFVVVGDHYDGRERLGIVRLSTSGAYDATLSSDGRVLYRVFPREHDLLQPWKVQVLNGGKIAIALAAFDLNSNNRYVFSEQAFVRLNANGTLDTSFHGDGVAVVSNDTSDVAFLPNGALYAGRDLGTRHEIRKLTPSATLDSSFSGDGRASVDCGTHFGAYLQVDQTGRPLMACRRDLAGSSWDFLLTRFTPTGGPDPAYGGGDGTTVLQPTTSDPEGGFQVEGHSDGTFWLAMRSSADDSILHVYSVDAHGDPNPTWGSGLSQIDVGFPVLLNRVALGGGRTWIALQKSTTTTALTAQVPGVDI